MKNTVIIGSIVAAVALATGGLVYYQNQKRMTAPSPAVSTETPAVSPKNVQLTLRVGKLPKTKAYLYSLAALDEAYRQGVRQFVVPLNWTSDEVLVCMGKWQADGKVIFAQAKLPLSVADFTTAATVNSQRPCTATTLAEWLVKHPDAIIVAELKAKPGKALQFLTALPGLPKERIVPLHHRLGLAKAAKKQEYLRFLWRPDLSRPTNPTVAQKAKRAGVEVLIPRAGMVKRKNALSELRAANIPLTVSGIHNCKMYRQALNQGAAGIMTASDDVIACTREIVRQ